MTDQLTFGGLSPSLQAVLSSLNVNLEAELNRYRRNRVLGNSSTDDLFADLEDPAFDLEVVESTIAIPTIAVPIAATAAERSPEPSVAIGPPSLPPNKKLIADNAIKAPADPAADLSSIDDVKATGFLTKTSSQDNLQTAFGTELSEGYLASSERLIASLQDVPEMPEPVDTVLKPRRKTLSLVAGATLGFLGLAAGLGASYLMSNPLVAQRLARGFGRDDLAIATTSKDRFDPPGPDLSEQEFVDIDIDNLSSLKMPQTGIDPSLQPPSAPGSLAPLPAIAGQPGTQPSAQPQTALPTETQAVAIPAGANYYVTVPFTTEQGLLNVRQAAQEAFVRQFADGNRIQLAAFDNPEDAQKFVNEVMAQGVTAQIYGPTTE